MLTVIVLSGKFTGINSKTSLVTGLQKASSRATEVNRKWHKACTSFISGIKPKSYTILDKSTSIGARK